jgi:hypothetical protein
MLYVNHGAASLQSIVVLSNIPLSEVERKISSFAALPNGWDYGRGGPISQAVLDSAFEWNRFFRQHGFSETDAFPGGDGEVVITAGYGDHDIELIVEPDGKISVAYDRGGKHQLYRADLASIEATWVVTNLMGQIWNASGYFIPINSTNVEKNLSSQHSVIQKKMGAYQLLGWNVLTSPDYQYANTLANFGAEPQEPEYLESSEFLPFFGSLNRPYSLSMK